MSRTYCSLLAVLAAGLTASSTATAAFIFPTIPGPVAVPAASSPVISLNDAGNSAGVTPGLYGAFSVTADWVEVSGNPFSIEAEIQLESAAGVADVDPPTTGGLGSALPTTLTFESFLVGPYDPDVDGTLDLILGQSFGGSVAEWSNIVVELLEEFPPVFSDFGAFPELTGPVVGSADEALAPGPADIVDAPSYGIFDFADLYELEWGGGDIEVVLEFSDDDGDRDLHILAPSGASIFSSTSVTDDESVSGFLPAGDYYVLVNDFTSTVPATYRLAVVPEPSTGLLLLLGSIGGWFYRRR